MKASHLVALASAVACLAPSAGFTQSPTRPDPSRPTDQRSATMPRTDIGGTYNIDGEVTKVDADKGWVDVKTPEGRMKLHFPTPALRNVKAGDRVTVELGLARTAAAAK